VKPVAEVVMKPADEVSFEKQIPSACAAGGVSSTIRKRSLALYRYG
jgi:hypothetical protein